jgi:methylated-DNA-protein-cysteine methyltransferase-like protein
MTPIVAQQAERASAFLVSVRSAALPSTWRAPVERHVEDGAMAELNFSQRVYEVVRRIPEGTVATYGQVAALAGNPRNARIVGYALHVNPEPGVIPCHRVVFRDGSLAPGFAFGGPERQRELLEAEHVRFIPEGGAEAAGAQGWRVDLERCQWDA